MVAESSSNGLDGAMNLLIQLRNEARNDKNWALSDKIRDELKANGIVLNDGKGGTTFSVES